MSCMTDRAALPYSVAFYNQFPLNAKARFRRHQPWKEQLIYLAIGLLLHGSEFVTEEAKVVL